MSNCLRQIYSGSLFSIIDGTSGIGCLWAKRVAAGKNALLVDDKLFH